jgi:hypothetical protein
MSSIVDQAQTAVPARAPFLRLEGLEAAAGRLNRGSVAVRIVIVAAAMLLAVAAQLSQREFDAGWALAAIALCAIVFALLALSLRNIGPLFGEIGAGWRAMVARRAAARADARFLARAQHDPRLMADLEAAMARHRG